MKIAKSILKLVTAIALLTLYSGCTSSRSGYDNPYAEVYERADKRAHFLGIYEKVDDSYAPPARTTLAMSSGDLFDRKNVSGKKTSVLWDLFTFTDY